MRKLITTLLILLSFTVPTLSSADDAGKLDESAAEQGDADAQYRLALMYFVGEGTPQDFKAAIKWHKKAAEQGHAQSQINLGNMYRLGDGTPQDYKAAIKWYKKAAEQGRAFAQKQLGDMYRKGEPETLDEYFSTVPSEQRKTQNKPDYKEALKWYTKVAEQGDAEAQYQLGEMYKQGKGMIQDYKEALKWYRKAAEQGYAYAQYSLGSMYKDGNGTTRDPVMSHMFYNIASANGNESGSRMRDIIAKEMNTSQIGNAQDLAREWMETH